MKYFLIALSLLLMPTPAAAQDACGQCITGYATTSLMTDLRSCESTCSSTSQNASQAQSCNESCFANYLAEYNGLSGGLCQNVCSPSADSGQSTSAACGQCVDGYAASQISTLNSCNDSCYQQNPSNPSAAQTCIEGCISDYQNFFGGIQSNQCATTCQPQGPTGTSAACQQCLNSPAESCNDVCTNDELNNVQNNSGGGSSSGSSSGSSVNSVPTSSKPVIVSNPFGNIVDARGLVARVLQGAMGIVGGIFFAMFVVAGVLYLTAAGNPSMIKKATNMMVFAIIGIVIISGAYILTAGIFRALLTGNPELGAANTGTQQQVDGQQ